MIGLSLPSFAPLSRRPVATLLGALLVKPCPAQGLVALCWRRYRLGGCKRSAIQKNKSKRIPYGFKIGNNIYVYISKHARQNGVVFDLASPRPPDALCSPPRPQQGPLPPTPPTAEALQRLHQQAPAAPAPAEAEEAADKAPAEAAEAAPPAKEAAEPPPLPPPPRPPPGGEAADEAR